MLICVGRTSGARKRWLTDAIDGPEEDTLWYRSAERKAGGHRAPDEAAAAGHPDAVVVVP